MKTALNHQGHYYQRVVYRWHVVHYVVWQSPGTNTQRGPTVNPIDVLTTLSYHHWVTKLVWYSHLSSTVSRRILKLNTVLYCQIFSWQIGSYIPITPVRCNKVYALLPCRHEAPRKLLLSIANHQAQANCSCVSRSKSWYRFPSEADEVDPSILCFMVTGTPSCIPNSLA